MYVDRKVVTVLPLAFLRAGRSPSTVHRSPITCHLGLCRVPAAAPGSTRGRQVHVLEHHSRPALGRRVRPSRSRSLLSLSLSLALSSVHPSCSRSSFCLSPLALCSVYRLLTLSRVAIARSHQRDGNIHPKPSTLKTETLNLGTESLDPVSGVSQSTTDQTA